MKLKNLNPYSRNVEKSELQKKTGQSAQQKNSSETENYTQDLIEIEDIAYGLIFLKNGSIVKILEILPINFFEKADYTQAQIASHFGFGFKQGPQNSHIKIMQTTANLDGFVAQLTNQAKKETSPYLKARIDDYIEHTQRLQKSDSTKNRFFYIFEYEGIEGKKSTNLNEIYEQMAQITHSLRQLFNGMGNYVYDYSLSADAISIAEILYSHYNPKSRKTEPFDIRMSKITEARNFYSAYGKEAVVPFADYIAPRGLSFGKTGDYVLMDGTYQTYLVLKANSFPQNCNVGELTNILTKKLSDCDIDIYIKQLSRETHMYMLDRTAVISSGVSLNLAGSKKQENLQTSSAVAKYIHECMDKNDEELYNVTLILTVRNSSLRGLRSEVQNYIRQMRSSSYYFEQCFLNVQDYWKMTQPLMNINQQIFRDNCRNMTNRSLAALYCFTSFEMFDQRGCCIGTTFKNPTLFSLYPFDSLRFPNPHMFLVGTTGAGKTYTELMISSRFRMHDYTTIFILPLKGHEYRDGVISMGGSFIPLRPGGKNCLNIMEIRPESEANKEEYEDADIMEEIDEKPSLLAKKITSILTWVRILAGEDRLTKDETSELSHELLVLYERFGITNDNDSIYTEDGRLKQMPIIEDMYKAFLQNDLLRSRASLLRAWVDGNCHNMNGQTNIDLTNRCLAFDIDEDIIGEDLLPGFMYIAFDCADAICKRSKDEFCSISLDEVWKMLMIPECAKQILKMIKILRAYHTSVIAATQDIEDALSNEAGRSLLTNSATKIFLKVTKEELEILEKSVSFSEENKNELLDAVHSGFITFGTERLFVSFKSSELEEYLYTTNMKRKRELKPRAEKKLKKYVENQ